MKVMPLDPNGHLFHEDKVMVDSTGNVALVASVFYACGICAEYPDLDVQEDVVIAKQPCSYPEGITTEIKLSVTSGKIIVTDDLRPVFDGFDHDGFASYNTALGQAQVVEAFAAQGCAFGSVGNSCPGLYRVEERHYMIASPEYDEEDHPSLPEESCLAGIITDLWAYSIADFEHWKSNGGNPENLGQCDSVIDFPNGVYKFTLHTGERSFDYDAGGTVIFADIEKID